MNLFFSYVNHHYAMLESSDESTVLEKDLLEYYKSIQTGLGDRPDWQDERPDEMFEEYVKKIAPGRGDTLSIREQQLPAQYERWLRSGRND